MNDIWTTVAQQRGALADDLAALTDEQWQTPSWCQGWTVQQALAHQTATAHTTPMGFVAGLAGARFNFARFVDEGVQRWIGSSPAQTLDNFRLVQHSTTCPPGPRTSWLGEAIIHAEDIRRPLGIQHDYPVDAVRQVADFYKSSNTLIGAKKRIAGLQLRATDTDWQHGDGPLVEGRLIDLLMAMTGRGAACEQLTGDGVDELRSRC